MSGLSGATVAIIEGNAFKLDKDAPDRVVAQGEWLQQNPAQHLPIVKQLLPSGYVMEQLDPIATHQVELPEVVYALKQSVWRYAPYNLVDTPQTMVKVSKIL